MRDVLRSVLEVVGTSGDTERLILSEIKSAFLLGFASIEYDPNRTARIALLHYADGEKRYILAPHGLVVGDSVKSGTQSEVRVGNALPLIEMAARRRYT